MMDIVAYKTKSNDEINQKIKSLRSQLLNSENNMERQECNEQIRYLKAILKNRRIALPKTINVIKDAPTVGEKRARRSVAVFDDSFGDGKVRL